MSSSARPITAPDAPHLPALAEDLPILYEDEEEGDMGESNPHSDAAEILHVCLKAHLAGRPGHRVFLNMNCYYRNGPPHPRTGSLPYVSPDVMVVVPSHDLGEDVSSYTVGKDGPAPVFVAEVLSERSAQQRDQSEKPTIYARMGVAEYLLADGSGKYLRERLLLKRLQPDKSWTDERGPDGGITSQLGFRIIVDTDGRLRVLDAATGRSYVRPDEAEQRVRDLEEQLSRLRGGTSSPGPKQKGGKRRKKS
jgi:Uma2 family endonuclease